MAASSYREALTRLFAHEGGYTNHPSDPGGPTKFGITLGDYRTYAKPDASAADVKAMRREEAEAIYRRHYWDAMRCDDLPAGLDYAVFDYGVHSGVGRALKSLQRLVGVAADGRVGDVTLAAIARRDTAELIAQLCDERLAFLKGLKTWPVFGAGWGRRVAEVRAAALAMAQAQPAAPRVSAKTAVSTGAIVAAGVAVAHQAQGSAAVLVALAVAAIALCGWLAWRHKQQRVGS